MAPLHLAIDVGERQLFAVVIDEETGTVTSEGALEPDQLWPFLKRLRPESVAIDAPNGFSRVGGRRAAERELGWSSGATGTERVALFPVVDDVSLEAADLGTGPPKLGQQRFGFED
jgi:hypothetical protein